MLLLFAFMIGCAQDDVWDRRIDAALEASPCPNVPQIEISDADYAGPLIDTHFHIPHLPDWRPRLGEIESSDSGRPVLGIDVSISDIACTLETEGTAKVFAFFPVFPEVDWQHPLEVAGRTMDQHSALFVPFIMPPGRDDVPPTVDVATLRAMLNAAPNTFRGYGEIGLYVLQGRRTAEDYPPDGPLLRGIYSVAKENDLIVYLHPGENHADNLETVLAQFPMITFIVHGEQIENDIGRLMAEYKNIYFTVNDLYGDQYLLHAGETTVTFLAALEPAGPLLEKDLATWKHLIEAHPDRFMWGTDRGDTVWSFDIEVGQALVKHARAFIGRLDPSVQEDFAYRNAEALLSQGE